MSFFGQIAQTRQIVNFPTNCKFSNYTFRALRLSYQSWVMSLSIFFVLSPQAHPLIISGKFTGMMSTQAIVTDRYMGVLKMFPKTDPN